MKFSLNKKIIPIILLVIILVPIIASAQVTPDLFGTGYLGSSNLPRGDAREVIVELINILLGILGTIFLILVLYGGFLWMTAGGNDDQAGKGRTVIRNAVIGLIVVFISFSLTTFVINILDAAARASN